MAVQNSRARSNHSGHTLLSMRLLVASPFQDPCANGQRTLHVQCGGRHEHNAARVVDSRADDVTLNGDCAQRFGLLGLLAEMRQEGPTRTKK